MSFFRKLYHVPLFLSCQRVTYHTKKPTHETRTIVEVEGAGVKAGKQAEWKEQIIVPPLPQSSLAGCNLIEINYFIQVSDTASLHQSVHLHFDQDLFLVVLSCAPGVFKVPRNVTDAANSLRECGG